MSRLLVGRLIAVGIFAVVIVGEALIGGHNWFAAVPPVVAMSAWGGLWAAGKKAGVQKKAGR